MLLKRLVVKLNENGENNLKGGLYIIINKCGIFPINRDRVLNMLPSDCCEVNQNEDGSESSILEFLKSMRSTDSTPRKTKKRLIVALGKSVETVSDSDLELETKSTRESSSDTHIMKHGITFENIIPIDKEDQVNVDGWV